MREKSFALWIVVGAVLLAVVNLPTPVSESFKASVRDAVAPLQGLLSGFWTAMGETVRSVRGIGGLVEENRLLSLEMARLRNEVRDLKGLEEQNSQLRESLGFVRRTSQWLIPCEVIGRDISGWWQTIRVDKGRADGVLADMAVITSDGLVGRTVAVSLHTADVLLITDPTCRVSAQVSRTGAFGVVRGVGAPLRGTVVCHMDFINRTRPVRAGDEVVTSGLGGVFPKGLLIGYADGVSMDDTGLYQSAEVVPRADIGTLLHVFVVVREEEGEAAL